MKSMSLASPEDIAREYGGNKKKISEAARIGLLDPTSALLAGMFIDKMRAAAAAEQSQDTTVAQDIFGGGLQALQPQQAAPTPPQQQVPPMPVQPAPQAAPQPQLAQAAPPTPQPMMAASGGIMHIPAGDVGNYAGGGIVAFASRGLVEDEDFIGRIAERGVPPMDQFPYGYREEDFGPQDRRQIRSNPFAPDFTMGATTPRDRLAAQLAFPPSEIGKAVNSPTPSVEIPSRTGKARNRLIDPEFRTSDPAKIARAKLDILQGELANQKQALATAKAPDEKARAEANIREIQREISIASRGKVAPSAAATDTPVTNVPPRKGEAAPQDFVGQARGIAESVYPASEKPTEPTVDTAFERSKQFLDKAGVDLNVFKKQREDVAEERRGYEKDKKQAGAFRILEAAAGILSGESQYGMVNIGKGLTPAVQGLASDVKEFQKNERALRAAERQLAVDEQKFNLTLASDAQANMMKDRERVDKYNQNKAALIGDITKSFISTAGSKDVAEVYTKGYADLQKLKAAETPDAVKSLNALASQLRKEDSKLTVQQSLQAAASLLRPERTMNATIGAISKAIQKVNDDFNALTLMDPTYKALQDKAAKGDVDAKKQLEAKKDAMTSKALQQLEDAMPGVFGVTPPPSTGDTGTPPPRPTALPANAPSGATYGNFVPGMGWEIKDKSGNLIGYGRQ
jgi:hypothetical protein